MRNASNIMRAAQHTLERLLQETESADLVISCGSKQWFLHSNIIMIRSPFLKEEMAGMDGVQMKVIEVKNMDKKTMEQVINYMHGIPIVLKVTKDGDNEDAYDLLEAADRLRMEDMKTELGGIIGGCITVQNALELGWFGETFNNEVLLWACATFIAHNTSIKIDDDQASKSPKLLARVLQRAQQFRERENRMRENRARRGMMKRVTFDR